MRNINIISTLVATTLIITGCGKPEALKPLDANSLAVPPQVMSVRIKGYRPQAGKTFQNLFVSNFSVKAAKGKLELSSSRDGMPDSLKQSLIPQYGFKIDNPESTTFGFADLLLFNSGITIPQQNLLYCSPNLSFSSSNDDFTYQDKRFVGSPQTFLGLRDCEKLYMGLDPKSFNSAGDGIPDYLKLRCGLNPLDKNDAYLSAAGDGVSNLDKCKKNIPIDESATSEANQLFAYQYLTEVQPDGSVTFTISNIPILNGGQDNFLAFYMTETDLGNKAPALYTAFAILKNGYANKTLQFDYWAKDPTTFFKQEVQVP